MDAVWPGLADVLEKIREKKAPVTTYEFDKLVYDHGDQPHDAEPEDWECKVVGRHLYKVMLDLPRSRPTRSCRMHRSATGLKHSDCSPGTSIHSHMTSRRQCLRTSSLSAERLRRTFINLILYFGSCIVGCTITRLALASLVRDAHSDVAFNGDDHGGCGHQESLPQGRRHRMP